MDSTENVPAKIQAEARARALAVLNSEPNCFSMIRPEDLETAALYVPVVTIIKPMREDFYDPIPKIGIMAKPPLMNLIREKAGVEILRTDTSKRGEHIWVGHAYGQKRGPDGTMVPDDASYEFNADERAEADILGSPDRYRTEAQKRLHVLEVAKFGEQRAVTGAQHSLICKMAKVARAFKTPEELMRGMKVLRVDRNVNGVLADPTMREVVINQMIGAKEAVFGPSTPPLGIEMKEDAPAEVPARSIDVDTGEITEPAAPAADPDQTDLFEDDPLPEPAPKAKPKADPVAQAKDRLRAYLKRPLPTAGIAAVNAMLDNPAATVKEIETVIGKCERTLAKNAEKAGAA